MFGGEAFGAPFVVDALREHSRLAWFELGPATQGDAVAVGNALARSVNAVLAGPLLPTALPYRSHLNALRHYRSDVLPLTIAITTSLADVAFHQDLLDLDEDGYRIIFDVRGDGADANEVLSRCRVLGADELGVTLDEAKAFVPGGIPTAEVEELWRATGGRFTDLSALANRRVRLPPLFIPSPAGPLLSAREAALVEPVHAIRAMERDGQLVPALELAVLHAPDMVEGLIRKAGPQYQEEGLLDRLHLLLSALPEQYARGERVLEWRLVAGFATGDQAAVIDDVDRYLQVHDAPELRARRAGSLPRTIGFGMAEQAVRSRRTALTVWQLGRLHLSHDVAIALLRESVELAEDAGSRYEVARNAATLAVRLFHTGQFATAASWSRWALDVFDHNQLQDGARRLQILNVLASARIMTGDLAGVRHNLEEAQVLVQGGVPSLATLLRATLAQLDLAEGRPSEALGRIAETYHASPRITRPRYGFLYVRALTEVGDLDGARKVAADVSEITAVDEGVLRSVAALARGITTAMSSGEDAVNDLMAAMLDRDLEAEQRLTAALYYLLASDGAAHNIPTDLAPLLRDIHPVALRVLSGPEERFAPVWATLTGKAPLLTFRFLGEVECRYEGRNVPLAPRLSEVALALVLHPDGMSRDQLNDFLTPDAHAPFSSGGMRGMMTRLRNYLPISDAPYRLTVPYRADVLEAREHIAAGRVREAVTLLRGPLLPQSEAPGVEEQRWNLEEELRQAALLVGDPDALYDLAERLDDDLQFWEAAVDSLNAGDPRLAIARARVRRLTESYGLNT